MNTPSMRALVIALSTVLVPGSAAAQHDHSAATAAPSLPLLGVVRCADGPPLAEAVVQLFHEEGAERHLVASTLSDGSGRFSVRTSPGTYVLRISYLGHATHERAIVLAAAPLNLGSVPLSMTALALDAIAVSAERERVQLRSGATVVDARSAAASAGGSIADLLRTVPGLEIDADGRISLRGSTSVLVLINGRRTALSDDALIAFLRQMPAGALERVEAGTSASAKQDADGVAGVVNLVFANAGGRSTARSVTASVADRDSWTGAASAAGLLAGRVDWNAAYSFSAMHPLTDSRTVRESSRADAAATTTQQSTARARHRLHSVSLGTALQFGTGSSIGARAAYSFMSGAYDNRTRFTDTTPAGLDSERITASVLGHTIPSADAAVTFTWSGAGPGRVGFTSEVRANTNDQDFRGSYADGGGAVFLDTDMNARVAEYVWQNDIAFDARGFRIETGHKSQLRALRADYTTRRGTTTMDHAFDYDDRTHAVYASAHGAVGRLQVQAGIRAESDRTAVKMNAADDDAAEDATLRFFPSVLIQWPHGSQGRTRLRASYARRLGRPDAAALNPYSMGEDDMNEFVGNPALTPEISDQLELGIELAAARATIQITPFLRVTHDPIRPLKTVTESGRATTTLHNLASARALGTDASVRAPLGARMTATFSTSIYALNTEAPGVRRQGVHVAARGMLDVRLADRTRMHLYAYRRGAQTIEQGEILPSTTSEFAFTQLLGREDRGRVTLRLRDPFRSDRLAFHLADADFVQHSSRRVTTARASLTFAWAVGGAVRDETVRPREVAPQIF